MFFYEFEKLGACFKYRTQLFSDLSDFTVKKGGWTIVQNLTNFQSVINN